MVTGDDVDSAVGNPLDNSSNIVRRSKRRIHFCIRVVVCDGGIRQCEVMRSHLGSDAQAASLSLAHQLDGLPGAEMSSVIFAAGQLRQDEIAGYDGLFGG